MEGKMAHENNWTVEEIQEEIESCSQDIESLCGELFVENDPTRRKFILERIASERGRKRALEDLYAKMTRE